MACMGRERSINKPAASSPVLRRCLGLSLIFHLLCLLLLGGHPLRQPNPMPFQRRILTTQWHSGPRISLQARPPIAPPAAPVRQLEGRFAPERALLFTDYVERAFRPVSMEASIHPSALQVREPLSEQPTPMPAAHLEHTPRPAALVMPHEAGSQAPEVVLETIPEPADQIMPPRATKTAAPHQPQVRAGINADAQGVFHTAVEAAPTASKTPAPAGVIQENRGKAPRADAGESPYLAAGPRPQPPSQPQQADVRPKSSYSPASTRWSTAQPAVTALTHTLTSTSGGSQPLLSSDYGTGSKERGILYPVGTASRDASSANTPSGGGTLLPESSGIETAAAAGSKRAAAMPMLLSYTDPLPAGKSAPVTMAAKGSMLDKASQSAVVVAPRRAEAHNDRATVKPAAKPEAHLASRSVNERVELLYDNQPVTVSQNSVPQASADSKGRVPIPAVPANASPAAPNRTLTPPQMPQDNQPASKTDEPLTVPVPLPRLDSELTAKEGADPDGTLKQGQISPAALEAIRQVKPQYPPAALRQGKEGVTEVLVKVSPEGVPLETAVAASSGRWDLDAAAIEAAKQWLFSPYPEIDGADGVWVTIRIEFQLND